MLKFLCQVLAGVAVCLGVSHADDGMPRQGVRVIEIRGTITAKLVPQIRNALEQADPDLFPAGAIVLLDSSGGDGLAAMEVGRLVRRAGAHTFVRGRCASACVFILAAGVVRGAPRDGAVGIHRGRITTFVRGVGQVDVAPSSSAEAALALDIADRRSGAYLREMGLPDDLFKAVMGVPAAATRYLSLAELTRFGLSGIDPVYLARRARTAEERYKLSEREFVERTAQAAGRCVTAIATPNEVVRCYRRLLASGE